MLCFSTRPQNSLSQFVKKLMLPQFNQIFWRKLRHLIKNELENLLKLFTLYTKISTLHTLKLTHLLSNLMEFMYWILQQKLIKLLNFFAALNGERLVFHHHLVEKLSLKYVQHSISTLCQHFFSKFYFNILFQYSISTFHFNILFQHFFSKFFKKMTSVSPKKILNWINLSHF